MGDFVQVSRVRQAGDAHRVQTRQSTNGSVGVSATCATTPLSLSTIQTRTKQAVATDLDSALAAGWVLDIPQWNFFFNVFSVGTRMIRSFD